MEIKTLFFKDYYTTPGVEIEASDEDLKKAYRRLIREYHPNLNKDKSRCGELLK